MSSEQTDHSLQIRIQLQSLKHGCRQFIQSGDRGIYLNEKYICQIIALARTMGTELRDIELRKKYALKYHHWIKETFEDGFVSEALNIKGVCPAIKAEIEKALSQLLVEDTGTKVIINKLDLDKLLTVSKEIFDSIERWLVQFDYLDESGIWIKDKQDLAAFIQFLIQQNIFKRQRKGFRSLIRTTFENRYQSGTIEDQFKLSNIQQIDQFKLLTHIIPVSR